MGELMGKLRLIVIVGVIGFIGYTYFLSDRDEQSADLGQVLDRTVWALEKYDAYLTENNVTEMDEAEYGQLTFFMTEVMNTEPQFYQSTLGVSMQADASFLGFADANGNALQDEGEGKVFTVEIDSENNRLIATDVAGASSHYGFSGTGLLAGMMIGNMLSRQSAAGVKPGSFNNRQTVNRANYKAPSSARMRSRSGGLSVGK